ncbi:hypothetical protein [Amycolatopsis cihanbeyliensis]|uniref:Uncharacterized protein n=1 Tax=Amycolatopsis cihanbeyliensis TaxID=1128664 RepID=A0A542DMP5_AMYCI|nr:hypothetical protein [Amycolatopsis cihanbeyliensis]TQJ04349.1 hypothetical protein FB471_4137 [Amycolatopsis cihanbeyliensis]
MKQEGSLFGLVSAVIGLVFAVSKLRQARKDKDKLRLANAVAGAAAVATEVAIAVRARRSKGR